MRTELNAPEWSEEYDPSKANKNGAYKKINREIVNDAHVDYLKSYVNKK